MTVCKKFNIILYLTDRVAKLSAKTNRHPVLSQTGIVSRRKPRRSLLQAVRFSVTNSISAEEDPVPMNVLRLNRGDLPPFDYILPVEPKPPAALKVSLKSSHSSTVTRGSSPTISWAIRSCGFIT